MIFQMAKITGIIPPQAYEYVRDKIANILTDELWNQVLLSGNYDLDVEMFMESNNFYIDKIDLSAVNVSLAKGSWANESAGSSEGTYEFYIDVYTNSKTSDTVSGDVKASLRLQRIAGVIRAILKNPIYKRLDFITKFIVRTTISEFNVGPATKDDALNTMMGRLSFMVTANETTELIQALMIEAYQTKTKLGNTQKGYFYEGLNY